MDRFNKSIKLIPQRPLKYMEEGKLKFALY